MIHKVDTVMPQTPIYSIVRMSNDDAKDVEYCKKRQIEHLYVDEDDPDQTCFRKRSQ